MNLSVAEILAFVGAALSMTVTAVGSVLWYLLKQKDNTQGEMIRKLFAICDIQKREHNEFRIAVAEGHYKKTELDAKFAHLDDTFKRGITEITARLEDMNKTLMDHFRNNAK